MKASAPEILEMTFEPYEEYCIWWNGLTLEEQERETEEMRAFQVIYNTYCGFELF